MNINKFIIYIVLVLLYLGLSKSLSPSELGINFVLNEQSLEKLVGNGPVSIILTDVHSTGFIIKTYYHKYKVVYGFQSFDEMITKTSSLFAATHEKHIGLEIMRRYDNGVTDHTPLPPGSVFIGDRNFGLWRKNKNDEIVWYFYRTYRHLPKYLGWHDFRPTIAFADEIQSRLRDQKVFYGFNDEFGSKGSVSKKAFPNYFKKKNENKNMQTHEYFKDFWKKNFRIKNERNT